MVGDQHREARCRPPYMQRRRVVRIAVAVSVAMALASCASMQQTVGGWFGAATPQPTPTPQGTLAAAVAPRVYYAGTEGLKVYSDSSASSLVVGQLSLHEKVTRTKLEHGFAYVESAKSNLKGWVNNSQLIWRLPSATTGSAGGAAPAPGEAQPEEPGAAPVEEPQAPAPEATATPTEELPPTSTPVPAAPAKAKPTAGGVAPSIFNPY